MPNPPPGHRLNHQSSCTPQLMEDIAGDNHYGVIIRTSDGGATAFKQLRPPPVGATGLEVINFITRRTAGLDVLETFDLFSLPGNPLQLPVNTWDGLPSGIDDHFGLAVGVDYLDRVWISGNARENFIDDKHSGPLHWTRYDPALGDFDDPASWTSPAYPAVFLACGPNFGHTYHRYARLSDGTLIFFLSQSEAGAAARGRDFLAFYLNATTAGTWQPLITTRLAPGLDKTAVAYPANDAPSPVGGGHFSQSTSAPSANVNNDAALWAGPANRVYVSAIHVEVRSPTVDRLHVLGAWRTADADGRSQQQPYYLYCDNPVGNSGGWKTITGAAQVMPFAWVTGFDNRVPSATIIPIGTIQQAVGTGIAIDDQGFPHFVLKNGAAPQDSPLTIWKPDATIPLYAESLYTHPVSGDQTSVMRVWWNGTAWQKRGIPVSSRRDTGCPVIAFVNGDGMMLAAHGSFESRVMSNWGETGATTYMVLGYCPWASEVNIDPVSISQRGEIAVVMPLADDVPKVFWWGGNAHAIANIEANNTNPGP